MRVFVFTLLVFSILGTPPLAEPACARIIAIAADPPRTAVKISPPAEVGDNNQNAPVLMGFDERQGAVTTAPLTPELPQSVIIARGTCVSSHYVIWDPASNSGATVHGTVTFDNDILGLFITRDSLLQSDILSLSPAIIYNSPDKRGLESNDIVAIVDARTISVNLTAGDPGDYFRVITMPNGDYNHDGVVDTADYTVWRDTLGTTGSDADGNANGVIDAGDYTVWKASFGTHPNPNLFAASSDAKQIPEPSTTILASMACLFWTACAKQNRSHHSSK